MSPFVRVALVGVLSLPQTALAAPFCMSLLGMSPQCIYYDAAECRKDLGKQGGSCVPNPEQPHAASGSGKYCLITSQGATVCSYLDIDSCDAVAVQQRGACYFDSTGSAGVPNPYAYSNGPQE